MLDEHIGLLASTQDRAHVDKRALADLAGLIQTRATFRRWQLGFLESASPRESLQGDG